ncbi:MAG: hypothetical protein K6G51_00425 [Sphaerochaetaceae bacterium]|nr:hypothetical protein [Sphaerochaetaceae bacterium]
MNNKKTEEKDFPLSLYMSLLFLHDEKTVENMLALLELEHSKENNCTLKIHSEKDAISI